MKFNYNWHERVVPMWKELFKHAQARRYLEFGSFEGASACCAIDLIGKNSLDGTVVCVDPWSETGKDKWASADYIMDEVKARFDDNIAEARRKALNKVRVEIYEVTSDAAYLEMTGEDLFDIVYVDGAHDSPSVLRDLVYAFMLVRTGGFIVCDDYFWSGLPRDQFDPIDTPKLAIDTFATVYCRKLDIVRNTGDQYVFIKRSE